MTTIDVQPETAVPAPAIHVVEDAPAIKSLKDRRNTIVGKLFKDLTVPRWHEDGGPKIVVRYGPIHTTRLEKSIEARHDQDEATLNTTADAMVDACIGIYTVNDEDEKLSLRDGDPHGTWTKFDQDLAKSLGLPPLNSTAADVCRYLYLTDGDLLEASNTLIAWSAIATDKADEDFTKP